MDDLLQAARAAKRHAYAPYSGLHVGASVRGVEGGIFSGCNVENAAYTEGLCAEAGAIAAMIAAGERHIVEVLVLADTEHPIPPCGGCRQKLCEFADGDVPIHICGPGGLYQTVPLAQLLPFAFAPHHLK